MIETRWYFSRSSTGDAWLHVDERAPPHRGVMTKVDGLTRNAVRILIPVMRTELHRRIRLQDTTPLTLYDPVEDKDGSSPGPA